MTFRHVAIAVLTFASVMWLGAIVTAASILHEPERHIGWRGAVAAYIVGSLVCHQRPERSFHTAGVRWPVCARCTGLYAGGAVGLLIWPVARMRRRGAEPNRPTSPHHRLRHLRYVALAVAAPTALTLASAAVGLYDPPNVWRAALALPAGALAGGLLAAVVVGDLR